MNPRVMSVLALVFLVLAVIFELTRHTGVGVVFLAVGIALFAIGRSSSRRG